MVLKKTCGRNGGEIPIEFVFKWGAIINESESVLYKMINRYIFSWVLSHDVSFTLGAGESEALNDSISRKAARYSSLLLPLWAHLPQLFPLAFRSNMSQRLCTAWNIILDNCMAGSLTSLKFPLQCHLHQVPPTTLQLLPIPLSCCIFLDAPDHPPVYYIFTYLSSISSPLEYKLHEGRDFVHFVYCCITCTPVDCLSWLHE